jgi:hypothetical protein
MMAIATRKAHRRDADARCAQPQKRSRQSFGAAKPSRISSEPNGYVIDGQGKNSVVEKITNPCGGPVRRALAGLARRCSTTLSTAFVDKRKIANASPVYRPFLHAMTTSAGTS